MSTSKAALVTGCSSGIGRATAIRLHKLGFQVYATARNPATAGDLADKGIHIRHLDVTDTESAATLVAEIDSIHGHVDILINNAGYGLSGALESTPLKEARAQFETNVFGLVGLTQLVLPGMRRARRGTLLNVSSIFGRYAAPGGGFYHASKHAVEAISDTLRLEVAGFGIKVILVEPGPVRTAWGRTFVEHLPGPEEDDIYGDFHGRMRKYYETIYGDTGRNLASMFTVAPDDVAKTIEKAVLARRPRARYPVGFLAASTITLRRFTPDYIFDNLFVRRQFPYPR